MIGPNFTAERDDMDRDLIRRPPAAAKEYVTLSSLTCHLEKLTYNISARRTHPPD
jgi:hypothetical protein